MICRMCILESLNVLNIFECSSTKYKIADTITQHFGFQILPDDSISHVICQTCWTEIENFHTYFVKVENAQKQFAQLRLQTTIKQDDTSAIEEIKSECETDPIESILMTDEAWQDEDLTPKDETVDDDPKEEVDSNQAEELGFSDNESSMSSQSAAKTDAKQNINSKTQESTTNSEIPTETSEQQQPTRKRRGRKRIHAPKTKTERAIMLSNVDDEIAKMTKLTCDQCFEKFDKFANIQQHFRTAHKMQGYVFCCLKKYFKRCKLYDHLITHFNPDQLKCEYCNKTYATKKSLRSHIQLKHSDGVRTFQCDKCPRRFLKESQLKYHGRNHLERESGDSFTCDECGKILTSSLALYAHRRTVHEQAYSYVCDICAKVIRSRTQFEQHMLEHEGVTEPMQKCTECNRWYKNMARLKRHQKSHSVAKERLICRYCGKASKTLAALRSHISFVHEAKLIHKCVLCEKVFKKKVALEEHIATHTGKELYNCPHCSRTFKSRANMHSHRKKAHRKEWEEARLTRGLPPQLRE